MLCITFAPEGIQLTNFSQPIIMEFKNHQVCASMICYY